MLKNTAHLFTIVAQTIVPVCVSRDENLIVSGSR